MKFRVDRKEFLEKLKKVSSVIKENKVKPIISCVLIQSEENIKLTGTDIERTIITTLDADIQEQGVVAVNPVDLINYLNKTKSAEIEIKVVDNMLEVISNKSTIQFTTMDSSDFPILNFEDEEKIEIETKTLLDLLDVDFAAAKSNDNMQVNCVRLQGTQGILNAVATDTYRLCCKEIKSDVEPSVSIPLETIKILKGILTLDEVIEMSFKGKLGVYGKDFFFFSKLIELPFPDYKTIVNNNLYDKKATVKNKELLELLERMTVIVKNNVESRYGALFEFTKNKLTVKSFANVNKCKEELEINYNGDDFKIALNCKYLIDALKKMKDEINFYLKTSNAMVKLENTEDANIVNIVMPLAFREEWK